MNTTKRLAATVTMAALATTLWTAQEASAKGVDVRSSGTCSAGAHWKLKAKAESPRVEVEVEVDSNRVGHLWRVALTDNGAAVFTGSARTTAPSGSFTVRRLITNRAGTDRISVVARDTATGQVCRGTVAFPG